MMTIINNKHFYYYFYFIIIIDYLEEFPIGQRLTQSNVQSHKQWNSQLGHNYRQLGSVQFGRIGRCDRVYNSTQLNQQQYV